MLHYAYILRCDDDSLYTGYTNDIGRRVEDHNNSDGAKYTAGRTPVKVVYVQIHNNKSCAMSEEYSIKQLSKHDKESMVGNEEEVCVDFCKKCFQ